MHDLKEALELYNMGLMHANKGNLSFAFDCLMRSIEAHPGVAASRIHLAITANKLAREREGLINLAILHAQEAARLEPHELVHWLALGEISLNASRFPEAIAAYEKVLSINPEMAPIWGLLGFAYARHGDLEAARNACERAVTLNPELGGPHFLLSTFSYSKFYDPAKTAFHGERGFQAKYPCLAPLESMWNSAHGYLTLGNYGKGWNYFEARLQRNSTNTGMPLITDQYDKPLWRGRKDCRLLIRAEMGLGDAFIMMRYLPMIKEKFNCEATFDCYPQMLALAQYNFPGVKCISHGSAEPDSFDEQIPMLSLPLIFKTKSYLVPWNGPYLKAEPEKTKEWRGRLALAADKPNVGLCWFSGRNSYSADNHHTSKRKSLTFEQMQPILDVQGINFISLQTENAGSFPAPDIKNFSDTAAILSLLDTIVTVDTAVANLAGAMGLNVWVMDRFDHCWRWSDIQTPWYPTAKIYRQAEPFKWNSVVQKIARDLFELRSKMAA